MDKSEYGLIIIDEAQLFLNVESMRHQYLVENFSAKKVVFLTATPIKSSKKDLYVYVEIAKKILKKDVSSSWIDDINTKDKKKDEIICSIFDLKMPVSRYFKDTIMSINIDGYKKNRARRLLPIVWEFSQLKSKDDVLLEKIKLKCSENINNRNNRFVIFTRFVEREAYKIKELLKSNGFTKYEDGNDDDRTYDVVTGENSYKLSSYSRTTNLPKVLIVTYQIAEQGVNLPGYNHVINYHISSFPSSLEQRFGRIDRMGKLGSIFDEINMCFLISSDIWDTNTCNFYSAVSIYLRNLISYLPSKNTILSEEIVDKYSRTQTLVDAYIRKIKRLVNDDKEVERLISNIQDVNKSESSSIGLGCDMDLFNFIEENSIEFVFNEKKSDITYKDAVKKFRTDVKNALSELKNNFVLNDKDSIERYKKIIKNVSDRIFYLDNDYKLITIDAVSECGEIMLLFTA